MTFSTSNWAKHGNIGDNRKDPTAAPTATSRRIFTITVKPFTPDKVNKLNAQHPELQAQRPPAPVKHGDATIHDAEEAELRAPHGKENKSSAQRQRQWETRGHHRPNSYNQHHFSSQATISNDHFGDDTPSRLQRGEPGEPRGTTIFIFNDNFLFPGHSNYVASRPPQRQQREQNPQTRIQKYKSAIQTPLWKQIGSRLGTPTRKRRSLKPIKSHGF